MVVVGGGIAGVSAAVAAARHGASVCLVERTATLGGLATAGLIAIYLPLCDGCGTQLAGGIAEELLKLSLKLGPGHVPEPWTRKASAAERARERYQTPFNPAGFALALDKWVLEAGVTLRFQSLVTDVSTRGDRIEALIVEEAAGAGALQADSVIDASGDATVAARCGLTTAEEDNWLSAWYYLARAATDDAESFVISLRILGAYADGRNRPRGTGKYSGIGPEDVTRFIIDSRRVIRNELASEQKHLGRERAFPMSIPSLPQFRTTRRLVGRHELEGEDDGRGFPDAVGMMGDWRRPGPVYQIPFRTLLATRMANLLVAGRCVSATASGLEIVRAIPACAVTGQAAGTAAALAARCKTDPVDLPIDGLQDALALDGVILPGR